MKCGLTLFTQHLNLYNKTCGHARLISCILPLQQWFECFIMQTNFHNSVIPFFSRLSVILCNSLSSYLNYPIKTMCNWADMRPGTNQESNSTTQKILSTTLISFLYTEVSSSTPNMSGVSICHLIFHIYHMLSNKNSTIDNN